MTLGSIAKRLLPRATYDSLAFRITERRIARTGASADVGSGPPLPPPYLRVLVVGNPDGPSFLAWGQAIADHIVDLAGGHGVRIDSGPDVLDWGCGCGRIARWIAPRVEAAGGRFTGSDLNSILVRWSKANLPGRYLRNGLRPPLKVPDASQDLLYAFSVVTHLGLPVTKAWLKEVRRVLRPGGLALISFHDEDWPGADAQAVLRDGFYTTTSQLEGSNHMASFTTRSVFAGLAEGDFEVLEIQPSDLGRQMQAWAVLKAV